VLSNESSMMIESLPDLGSKFKANLEK